jgi:hypothetical protein
MAELTEGTYAGEFMVSEANGTRSRKNVTILSGENVVAGEVLGEIVIGAATGAAVAGNTGNGTITAAPAVAAGAKLGVYSAVCIEPGTNVGEFLINDPDGVALGVAVVAVEFVGGGLTFTIADGSTDFAAGDAFTITVAAGSGKYVAYDEDGITGAQTAAGIAYAAVDATSGDVVGAIIARDAEVNGSELTWPSTITDGEKAAAVAQLATLGIIVR